MEPGGKYGPQGGNIRPGGGMKLMGSSCGAKEERGGGMTMVVESSESDSDSFFLSLSDTRFTITIFFLRGCLTG